MFSEAVNGYKMDSRDRYGDVYNVRRNPHSMHIDLTDRID